VLVRVRMNPPWPWPSYLPDLPDPVRDRDHGVAGEAVAASEATGISVAAQAMAAAPVSRLGEKVSSRMASPCPFTGFGDLVSGCGGEWR
jgi:hypothetical protein